MRVAREDEPLPGDVLGELKRAEADDVGDRASTGTQTFWNCPASSAASSLCFGRIGRLSSSRSPGANGSGKRTTTVRASGAVTSSGLPWTVRAEASGLPTLGSYAARNEKRTSAEVSGCAVGELQARPERDRVGRGRRPTPSSASASHGSSSSVARLTRTSRAWVRKVTTSVAARRAGGDVAVVGRRLGSNRRHELAAARRRRGRRPLAARRVRSIGSRARADKQPGAPTRRSALRGRGHDRPQPANFLAGLQILRKSGRFCRVSCYPAGLSSWQANMLAVSVGGSSVESGDRTSNRVPSTDHTELKSRLVSLRTRFSAARHLLLMSVARTVPRAGHPANFELAAAHDPNKRFSSVCPPSDRLSPRARLRSWPRRFPSRRASAARVCLVISSERLAARVEASTDIIVTGSDEQVQTLATRYGARVKKRLRNAAVLEVTGGQLRDLERGRRRVERLRRRAGADDGDA